MKKNDTENIQTGVSEEMHGKRNPIVNIPNSCTKVAMDELKAGKGNTLKVLMSFLKVYNIPIFHS